MKNLAKKAALTLFILFLVAVGQKLSSSDCIDSSVVKSIVTLDFSESVAEQSVLTQCNLIGASYQLNKNADSLEFAKKLESLDSVLGGLNVEKKDIFISLNEPFAQANKKGSVVVGYEVAKSEQRLERAVIESYLSFANNNDSEAFLREILAHVLVGMSQGHLSGGDPITRSSVSYENLTLYSSLKNTMDYCNSKIRSHINTLFCERLNTLGIQSEQELYKVIRPSVWSLSPLISQVIFEYIAGAKNSGIKKNIKRILKEKDISKRFQVSLSIISLEEIRGFDSARTWLSLVIPTILRDISESREVVDYGHLNQIFEAKNISGIPLFNYKATVLDGFHLNFESFQSDLQKGKSIIVHPLGSGALLSQGNKILGRYGFRYNHATEILFGCKKPSREKINRLEIKQSEVIFIENCNNQVDFNKLANMGIESYLQNHKHLKFVKFEIEKETK